MKSKIFLIAFIVALAAEVAALLAFACSAPDPSQNVVEVNEIVQTVTRDFYALDSHENLTSRDYAVISADGELLFSTRSGLSESINDAITHRDTVLDISRNGTAVGKVIIYNDSAATEKAERTRTVAIIAVAIALSVATGALYLAFLHATIVEPFKKLNGFAERVAGGNLDIPLEMDRRNLFGAFTEGFDIMRSELKKARIAEAQANQSKKELVAKLSHDIKTPVASISAVAEVGLATAKTDKDRDSFARIMEKSAQISSLVNNLFTATLEEMEQLDVCPVAVDGNRIRTLLQNADYLDRAALPDIPSCVVTADPLRLQQVFDNIFANSYKYAGTDIEVKISAEQKRLLVTIEDFGGGVPQEELPVLKEKFRRGANSVSVDGAGLGLYISDYFMRGMGGELQIENGEHGLRATVILDVKVPSAQCLVPSDFLYEL